MCAYSLANVEFEGDPSLCNVHSRPVVRMLKDGVAVEPGVAFQHHKPETTVLQISFIVWYYCGQGGGPGVARCGVRHTLPQQKISFGAL
jgi:hypothetical protein